MFVVMVNGELAENATMKLFSLFGTATKKNHVMSYDSHIHLISKPYFISET